MNFLEWLKIYGALKFGDGSRIAPRGRWPHHTKSGPGRRRTGPWNPAGAKLMRRFYPTYEWRQRAAPMLRSHGVSWDELNQRRA